MKKRWVIATLILLLCLGGSLPTSAQGVVSVSIDELELDGLPQAKALVTVRNENGVPIAGLAPDAFEIVEDASSSFPPSEIAAQVNSEAVISVVMVIDISGSMKGKPIQEAMRAANALIDQLSLEDRAAIIAFADEVDTDTGNLEDGKEYGFTTDKNALRNVVNFLDTKIGWDTPLYDAVYKGVKLVAAEPAGKRAVVVLTDGRDEKDNAKGTPVPDAGSLVSPDDPINEANRHNVPVFTVGLEGLGGKIDTKYLRRMAERTGGIYQRAPEPEELTPLFENAVSQLKQQYVLGYNSRLKEDGNYHSLLVRVQLPQGQAFDEIKFPLGEVQPPAAIAADTPDTSDAATDESQSPALVTVSESSEDSGTTAQPPPAATVVTEQSWVETIRASIQENPLLAVVIGAGLLLLIALIIALLVVLLRGRGHEEELYPSEEFLPTHHQGQDWGPEPVGGGTPLVDVPLDSETSVATPGWPGVEEPVAPPAEPGIPQPGGTRIIERAPKHLAMIVSKSNPDQKHDLKKRTNIGRAQDNQVVIDEPTVSRYHAWIKADGEDFTVFDIGSGNGTFVNGEKVEEPTLLQQGDSVRFGDAEFVFTKVF